MNFLQAQKKIATLWFILSGVLFMILILQVLLGKYADHYLEIGAWYSQTVLPSLSIISSTLLYVHNNKDQFSRKQVDTFLFSSVKYLTWFYFLIIFLFIAAQPMVFKNMELSGLDLLKQSSFWLSLLQSLLSIFLGIFFIKNS